MMTIIAPGSTRLKMAWMCVPWFWKRSHTLLAARLKNGVPGGACTDLSLRHISEPTRPH